MERTLPGGLEENANLYRSVVPQLFPCRPLSQLSRSDLGSIGARAYSGHPLFCVSDANYRGFLRSVYTLDEKPKASYHVCS